MSMFGGGAAGAAGAGAAGAAGTQAAAGAASAAAPAAAGAGSYGVMANNAAPAAYEVPTYQTAGPATPGSYGVMQANQAAPSYTPPADTGSEYSNGLHVPSFMERYKKFMEQVPQTPAPDASQPQGGGAGPSAPPMPSALLHGMDPAKYPTLAMILGGSTLGGK
jgi:hypothetical protein